MRIWKLAALSLVLAAPLGAKPAVQPAADVASAVASRDRTPDNVKLDESRKPAQLLAYLGLKKNMGSALRDERDVEGRPGAEEE